MAQLPFPEILHKSKKMERFKIKLLCLILSSRRKQVYTFDWCLLGFQLIEGMCLVLKLLGRFNSTLNMNIPELRGSTAICVVSDFRSMPKTPGRWGVGTQKASIKMPHLSVRINVFIKTR